MFDVFLSCLVFGVCTTCLAGTFTESFINNPLSNGWQIFGDTNLFRWNVTNQNLQVTWDSSRPNSYFYRRLGTILSREDDFALSFDLVFQDYAIGTESNKASTFEAAIGFLNLDNATQTNFSRGSGVSAMYGPKNLLEFDFFPAFDVFSPTIAQTIVSTNNSWLYNHDNLLDMSPGYLFHVAMSYSATTRTLTTITLRNGAQYGQTQTILVPTNFDFRLPTFSISSYSDQNADGSIQAQCFVDNIVITTPPPPIQNLSGVMTNRQWQVVFTSRTNWTYLLERTQGFQTWSIASAPAVGTGGTLILQDTNVVVGAQFYHVRAQKVN